MTRVEYERRRRQWNQTALAYHSGTTQGEVSLIERRRLVPTVNVAERIARVLELPPESLQDDVTPLGETAEDLVAGLAVSAGTP
jgi:transcriptional regulator with XRE-family HTH domain